MMQNHTVNTQSRNKSYHKIEKEDLSEVNKIYHLYMAGWFTLYITNLMGYKLARVKRKDSGNSIIANSHYNYQVKIMNINFLLTLLCVFGSLTYITYIISQIDFMNLEAMEKTLEDINSASTLIVLVNFIPSIITTLQSFIGMRKAKNYQQV